MWGRVIGVVAVVAGLSAFLVRDRYTLDVETILLGGTYLREPWPGALLIVGMALLGIGAFALIRPRLGREALSAVTILTSVGVAFLTLLVVALTDRQTRATPRAAQPAAAIPTPGAQPVPSTPEAAQPTQPPAEELALDDVSEDLELAIDFLSTGKSAYRDYASNAADGLENTRVALQDVKDAAAEAEPFVDSVCVNVAGVEQGRDTVIQAQQSLRDDRRADAYGRGRTRRLADGVRAGRTVADPGLTARAASALAADLRAATAARQQIARARQTADQLTDQARATCTDLGGTP